MQRSIGFHVPSELAGSQPSIAAAAFCNPASVMMPSAGVRAVLFILSFQNGRAMVEGHNTRQQSSFRRLWRRRSRAASGCRSTRRPARASPLPPPPNDMGGATVELALPIQFKIKR
jgi:hypothetical protein